MSPLSGPQFRAYIATTSRMAEGLGMVPNIIEAAAANAETASWSKAEERTGWYVEQFTENGMTLTTMDGEVPEAFKTVGVQLRADWLQRFGEAGAAIIECFEAN